MGCGSRANPLERWQMLTDVDRCWQMLTGYIRTSPVERHPLPVCTLCLTNWYLQMYKNCKCKHSALAEHWDQAKSRSRKVGLASFRWISKFFRQVFSSQGLDRSVEHLLPRANCLQRSICDLGWYYVHWYGGADMLQLLWWICQTYPEITSVYICNICNSSDS